MSPSKQPLLPIAGARNILVTSALPYVNNVPHLGNIIGCVLSADVYARFCRLRGHNVIYVCGTDEYGTATEQKAIQEGLTPKQICDKYHEVHAQVYKWFNIDFDVFGRTSAPVHKTIVQDVFAQVEKNGMIHEDDVEQLFCTACNKFLADRYVGGTCPDCGYVGAHGDQCDGCGHLMNAILLKNPYCAADKTTPVVRKTRHVFLDLPVLTDRLVEWIDEASVKGQWSANSLQVTRAWLKTGLKSRSITRDLKWGVPVPRDGFRDKVFYVWFDAPIGYMSITAAYTPDWHQWWRNPENVELVQFMGKDNIPFHTVIWPCTLIGADNGYTLLHHISTTEYLNYETGKFSKSRGVGVFGDSAQLTGVPSSVWRYYLLANRPENADTIFTWDDFQQKNNGELLKNLGNFVHRALTFVQKFFDSAVPASGVLSDGDREFMDDMNETAKAYVEALEKVQLKDGIRMAMQASSRCNLYFQVNEPWKLVKEGDIERAGTVVNMGINAVIMLATLIEPYMPELTDNILTQLNLDRSTLELRDNDNGLFHLKAASGHKINSPEVLFEVIPDESIALWRKSYGGQNVAEAEAAVEFPLNLVTGKILRVESHPSAEHLYVFSVDIGDSTRPIVSGLRAHYQADDLVGKKVVVVKNLKPGNFRGTRSIGMILCAVQGDKTGLLLSSGEPGDAIIPKGMVARTTIIDMKKDFAAVAADLLISGDEKRAMFGTRPLVVNDDQAIIADGIVGDALIR